jgi:hypothetical protein
MNCSVFPIGSCTDADREFTYIDIWQQQSVSDNCLVNMQKFKSVNNDPAIPVATRH